MVQVNITGSAAMEEKLKPIVRFSKSLMPQEETLETNKHLKKLVIGVPKEIQADERRIPLTPLAVELLVNNGHMLYIESDAGKESNFCDADYIKAGAIILQKKEEIYQCDILLKIAPLTTEECDLLKGNQIVISALNIGTLSKDYIDCLILKKLTALAYEFIKDQHDGFPVVSSMSEIVGITSILIASEYLSNEHDGKGKILGGVTGVNPSEVVVLGAGTAGEFAASTALGLGAIVKVFDTSVYKLRRLQNNLHQRIFTSIFQPTILANALKSADVVIGALRIMDESIQYIVPEDMVMNMKNGSVIIDISIDQGGCFETSKVTSHKDPVFRKHGVIHYCVPNIASRVARTASYALSNIFAPVLLRTGECGGLEPLIKEDAGLRNGVYIYKGILTNSHIGKYFGVSSKDIDLFLSAF
ncbi:MAG: alanine dehydrogenase [Bacteroidia bacterium]|nr:alanine dehydrogenase [Bacteroidia bacterium]